MTVPKKVHTSKKSKQSWHKYSNLERPAPKQDWAKGGQMLA